MIEFFTFGSTNGHKVAIAQEELGLSYEVHGPGPDRVRCNSALPR